MALVVDNNTELSTSFMQSVVPAGIATVKALPPGTTIDVWTTGDRPSRVAKAVDAAGAETALKGVGAIGTNALLNTMSEASQALPTDDGHRTAVIVMTGSTLGDAGGYEQSLKATSTKPTFLGLELFLAHPDARIENALEMFAAQTGGYFDRILSITAFEKRGSCARRSPHRSVSCRVGAGRGSARDQVRIQVQPQGHEGHRCPAHVGGVVETEIRD